MTMLLECLILLWDHGKSKIKNPRNKILFTKSMPEIIFCRPTNKEEIKRVINSLDRSKSTGPYSIPYRILNILNEELANILSKFFNSSISKGKFIDVLKIVKMIPIFKNKGSLKSEFFFFKK